MRTNIVTQGGVQWKRKGKDYREKNDHGGKRGGPERKRGTLKEKETLTNKRNNLDLTVL